MVGLGVKIEEGTRPFPSIHHLFVKKKALEDHTAVTFDLPQYRILVIAATVKQLLNKHDIAENHTDQWRNAHLLGPPLKLSLKEATGVQDYSKFVRLQCRKYSQKRSCLDLLT